MSWRSRRQAVRGYQESPGQRPFSRTFNPSRWLGFLGGLDAWKSALTCTFDGLTPQCDATRVEGLGHPQPRRLVRLEVDQDLSEPPGILPPRQPSDQCRTIRPMASRSSAAPLSPTASMICSPICSPICTSPGPSRAHHHIDRSARLRLFARCGILANDRFVRIPPSRGLYVS